LIYKINFFLKKAPKKDKVQAEIFQITQVSQTQRETTSNLFFFEFIEFQLQFLPGCVTLSSFATRQSHATSSKSSKSLLKIIKKSLSSLFFHAVHAICN